MSVQAQSSQPVVNGLNVTANEFVPQTMASNHMVSVERNLAHTRRLRRKPLASIPEKEVALSKTPLLPLMAPPSDEGGASALTPLKLDSSDGKSRLSSSTTSSSATGQMVQDGFDSTLMIPPAFAVSTHKKLQKPVKPAHLKVSPLKKNKNKKNGNGHGHARPPTTNVSLQTKGYHGKKGDQPKGIGKRQKKQKKKKDSSLPSQQKPALSSLLRSRQAKDAVKDMHRLLGPQGPLSSPVPSSSSSIQPPPPPPVVAAPPSQAPRTPVKEMNPPRIQIGSPSDPASLSALAPVFDPSAFSGLAVNGMPLELTTAAAAAAAAQYLATNGAAVGPPPPPPPLPMPMSPHSYLNFMPSPHHPHHHHPHGHPAHSHHPMAMVNVCSCNCSFRFPANQSHGHDRRSPRPSSSSSHHPPLARKHKLQRKVSNEAPSMDRERDHAARKTGKVMKELREKNYGDSLDTCISIPIYYPESLRHIGQRVYSEIIQAPHERISMMASFVIQLSKMWPSFKFSEEVPGDGTNTCGESPASDPSSSMNGKGLEFVNDVRTYVKKMDDGSVIKERVVSLLAIAERQCSRITVDISSYSAQKMDLRRISKCFILYVELNRQKKGDFGSDIDGIIHKLFAHKSSRSWAIIHAIFIYHGRYFAKYHEGFMRTYFKIIQKEMGSENISRSLKSLLIDLKNGYERKWDFQSKINLKEWYKQSIAEEKKRKEAQRLAALAAQRAMANNGRISYASILRNKQIRAAAAAAAAATSPSSNQMHAAMAATAAAIHSARARAAVWALMWNQPAHFMSIKSNGTHGVPPPPNRAPPMPGQIGNELPTTQVVPLFALNGQIPSRSMKHTHHHNHHHHPPPPAPSVGSIPPSSSKTKAPENNKNSPSTWTANPRMPGNLTMNEQVQLIRTNPKKKIVPKQTILATRVFRDKQDGSIKKKERKESLFNEWRQILSEYRGKSSLKEGEGADPRLKALCDQFDVSMTAKCEFVCLLFRWSIMDWKDPIVYEMVHRILIRLKTANKIGHEEISAGMQQFVPRIEESESCHKVDKEMLGVFGRVLCKLLDSNLLTFDQILFAVKDVERVTDFVKTLRVEYESPH